MRQRLVVGCGQLQVAAQYRAFKACFREGGFHRRSHVRVQPIGGILHIKAVDNLRQGQVGAGKALRLRKAEPLLQRPRRGIVQANADVHSVLSFH